jgi:hypothetical protein
LLIGSLDFFRLMTTLGYAIIGYDMLILFYPMMAKMWLTSRLRAVDITIRTNVFLIDKT